MNDFSRIHRILSLLAVVLAVAGCGDSGDLPDTATGGAPPPEASSTPAQSGGAVGGDESDQLEGEPPGDDHLAEIHLGADRAAALGVQVQSVTGGSARSIVQRPATLEMDPDRKALVGPRVEAKVVRVLVDLGDPVEEGDSLAILSSVELGGAKSDFLTVRARLATAEAAYERERSLRESRISSEAELLETQARFAEARAELDASREALRLYGLTEAAIDRIDSGTEAPLSEFALLSPVSGRIQRRDVSPGQTVGPGETPIHVANVERLWAMIEAYDQDVPLLEVGRPVELSVRGLPDRTFDGEIDWVSYELDPETRTLAVRTIVENPDGVLRAGMYGTARLSLSSDMRLAVVPVDAIQTLEGRDVVFVPADEPGAFRPVEVIVGEESQDGWVEVRSGLSPGEEAVVAGAFDLMSAATSGTRSADHSH